MFLICAVLGASSYYLVKKTETEKRLKAERSAAQSLKQQENQQKALELRTRILAEKNARLAALEAQKAAELAAKTKAEADKLRLENELADQLEAERRIIEKKQAEREIAWEHYIGTKYPSLVVVGKTFNDVTVTSVSAVGVTIAYEHGARRFKYDDLSSAIQELCHYDPDVSELAFAEEQKARTHYN